MGSRIRQRRTVLGLTQERLGDALGLTFQQVQKYERGANRIGASRLYELCRILDVPVGFFFDDLGEDAASGLAEPPAGWDNEDTARREALELIRAFSRISDPVVRRRLLDLARALGQDGDDVRQVGSADDDKSD